MKKIDDILREHAFFQDLTDENTAFIAGCAKNVVFQEQEIIAHPGSAADQFYLIRHGRAALIIDVPNGKPFMYQTLGENEILGLSWLIPPYKWNVTAQATETLRAISLDGKCLREKCESDPSLGYKLMKRLAQVLAARDSATMLHLLDVYGKKNV